MPAIKGKWKFNDEVRGDSDTFYVNFTSNNQSFSYIEVFKDHGMWDISYENELVYDSFDAGWENEAWQHIDFGSIDQTVTQDFYDWFTANAEEETSQKQFDLSTHTWTTSGIKQISVVSHGAGYSDSVKSNIVTYNVYDIEQTLTNVTKSGADVIGEGQTATLTITADAGYDLPDGITVNGVTGAIGFTGCTWVWDKATGKLSISNPTQNVFVTVTGTAASRNRFVCVGSGGNSYYSTDGVNWTAMSGLYSTTYYGVAYGNNRFVCVGYGGNSYYSTDGVNWTAMSGLASAYHYGVTYGNGRFVCVGIYSNSGYSTNGTSWTAMSGLASSYYWGVTYGNGRFVCVGGSGKSYYSTNGTSWTAMSGLPSYTFYGVTYGNGRFVCVGEGGKSYYSTNGTSWNTMSGLDSVRYYGVTYGNGRFVCVGENGKSYYSTNGTSWTAMSGLDTSSIYRGATYGNGRFVCVGYGGKSYYSTNGTSWTAMSGLYSTAYYGVTYGELV